MNYVGHLLTEGFLLVWSGKDEERLREDAKKFLFLVVRAQWSSFFCRASKSSFSLVVRPITLHPLVVGPLRKERLCGFPQQPNLASWRRVRELRQQPLPLQNTLQPPFRIPPPDHRKFIDLREIDFFVFFFLLLFSLFSLLSFSRKIGEGNLPPRIWEKG